MAVDPDPVTLSRRVALALVGVGSAFVFAKGVGLLREVPAPSAGGYRRGVAGKTPNAQSYPVRDQRVLRAF
ncbi:hypothetical protein MARA_39730 [Mycolicibacterium arabiense]|uniref:Uncharacterized protein n=1 Tax=Mycolicibacterium arabiense TaxID=1286181 RepID=A0A7I7S3G4_9MYCO|nr:hypothetical protein MARA_39730 [Mycolicibacterium arabiense]